MVLKYMDNIKGDKYYIEKVIENIDAIMSTHQIKHMMSLFLMGF